MGLFDQFARLYSDVSKRRQAEKDKQLQDVFNGIKLLQAQNDLDLYPEKQRQLKLQNESDEQRIKQNNELYPLKKQSEKLSYDIAKQDLDISKHNYQQKKYQDEIERALAKSEAKVADTKAMSESLLNLRKVLGTKMADYAVYTPSLHAVFSDYNNGKITAQDVQKRIFNLIPQISAQAKQMYEQEIINKENANAEIEQPKTTAEVFYDNVDQAKKTFSNYIKTLNNFRTMLYKSDSSNIDELQDRAKQAQTNLIINMHRAGFNVDVISASTSIPNDVIVKVLENNHLLDNEKTADGMLTQQNENIPQSDTGEARTLNQPEQSPVTLDKQKYFTINNIRDLNVDEI